MDFGKESGMGFTFGIWHAFFAMLCFGGGFLSGFTNDTLFAMLGVMIYFFSYYFALRYTVSGCFREMFQGKKVAMTRIPLTSFQVLYGIFCFAFSNFAGTFMYSPKDLFSVFMILTEIYLFYRNFYLLIKQSWETTILREMDDTHRLF